MEPKDELVLGQLVVEIRQLQAQNHKDHAELKTSMDKDRERAEKLFDDLYNRLDRMNVQIAKMETLLITQTDRAETLEVKMNRLDMAIPAMESRVESLTWFNRILIGGFIAQLIAMVLRK